MCQGHEKLEEQRFKKRSNSNFQTRNKIKLCDSRIKIEDLRSRT
jgi:hypothetical protein